jgi:8-oxo-dGTP pyrophosphatase MutT (NUDIX family)
MTGSGLHLDDIRRKLGRAGSAPAVLPPGTRGSAVALVLAGAPDALSACFILRAQRPGDPWSGHMALPGGRGGPEDAGAHATAERETREEVGLVLGPQQLLGALRTVRIRRWGHETEELLSAFVYYAGPALPSLEPNAEVARAMWVPLGALRDPARATSLVLPWPGGRRAFPGVMVEGEIVWGLTYRVLAVFWEAIGQDRLG